MKNLAESNVIELGVRRSNRRDHSRHALYKGETPPIDLKFGSTTYHAPLYDLSCDGIGIIAPPNMKGLDFKGQPIKVRLNPRAGKFMDGIITNVVSVKRSGEIKTKIGIKILNPHTSWKPRGDRIACPEFYKPTVSAENPYMFGHTLHFEVLNFSSGGMRLITSSDNFFIVPGTIFSAQVNLPGFGAHNLDLTCTNSSMDSDEKLSLGFEYLSQPNDKYLSQVSEYLLASNAAPSVTTLKENGFLVDTIERALTFFYPRTEKEFNDLLRLRLLTAKGDGRWQDEDDFRVMLDEYDHHARHVVCRIGDTYVGAGRIVFNNGFKERSEHVGYNQSLPEYLWQEGFIEVSRLCTHPEYRGSDILINLIRQIARIVTQTGHKNMVLNCVDELVPIYERIGAEKLGAQFYTKYMEDRPLNLLLIRVDQCFEASNMTTANWGVIAEPITNHLIKNNNLKLKLWQRLKIRMLSVIAKKIIQPNFQNQRRKKAKKKISDLGITAPVNTTTSDEVRTDKAN